MKFVSAILLGLLMAGCAAPSLKPMTASARQTSSEAQKQREIYTEVYVADLKRVRRVHWELATKAAALCPRKAAALGTEILTKPKGGLGLAMEKLYGVGTSRQVLFVLEGGPAESAGLKPRDRVISIDGIPAGQAKAIADRLRTASDGAPVSLPVVARRGSDTLVLAVTPVRACDYPVAVDEQQSVNAYTDGERILVARGMVPFAQTDAELALVIAHEMAHNTMNHIYAKRRNDSGGILADIALKFLARGLYQGSMLTQAASHAYSQESRGRGGLRRPLHAGEHGLCDRRCAEILAPDGDRQPREHRRLAHLLASLHRLPHGRPGGGREGDPGQEAGGRGPAAAEERRKRRQRVPAGGCGRLSLCQNRARDPWLPSRAGKCFPSLITSGCPKG